MTDPAPLTVDPADDAQRDVDPVMSVGIAPSGPRMPADMRLGHVSLQVSNLARSIAYYETVLGLRVVDRSASHAMLGTEDGETLLVALTERAGARPSPQHARLGLYHFAILLPDRAALGRFVAHLGDVGARAGASDHLVSEAIYLRDPDGLGIEVYADRPRESWRVAQGQLQMSTAPLDLADVVRAARGEPWTGMPGGTTMGHVHLHVGDLELASRFYHEALGLDKTVWTYQGALFLSAGGYHHHLGLNVWAGPNAPKPTADDARLLEWRVVLRSRAAAADVAESVQSSGFDVRESGADWLATDPWDTTVRLAGAE